MTKKCTESRNFKHIPTIKDYIDNVSKTSLDEVYSAIEKTTIDFAKQIGARGISLSLIKNDFDDFSSFNPYDIESNISKYLKSHDHSKNANIDANTANRSNSNNITDINIDLSNIAQNENLIDNKYKKLFQEKIINYQKFKPEYLNTIIYGKTKLEAIIDNAILKKRTPFKRLIHGDFVHIYNNRTHLKNLEKEKIIKPNRNSIQKKIYEQYHEDKNFQRQYKSFNHYLESLLIPIYENDSYHGYMVLEAFEHGNGQINRNQVRKILSLSRDFSKKWAKDSKKINESLFSTRKQIFNLIDTLKQKEGDSKYSYTHSHNTGVIFQDLLRFANKFEGVEVDSLDFLTAYYVGMLHDIGKIQTPNKVLLKPGKLDKDEFEKIKKHPMEGYELLLEAGAPKKALEIALDHHENLMGTGYPKKKKNESISQLTKLFQIVDIYDAMTAKRPYPQKRKTSSQKPLNIGRPFNSDEALEEIIKDERLGNLERQIFSHYIDHIKTEELPEFVKWKKSEDKNKKMLSYSKISLLEAISKKMPEKYLKSIK